jgi:hypothetical protein
MSFYDLADQYDALTKQLRDLSDQAALGTYTVGVPPEELTEPAPATSATKDAGKK